jgi:enhancer of polycomb-like protein
MVPPTRVVRIKKLSKTQGQQIVRQDQIDDYDSLQSQSSYDTGVEKGEEKVNIAPVVL